MSNEPGKRMQPEPASSQQVVQNRKAAKKTAIILGVVAVGFFVWSAFIVINHAKG